MNTTIERQDVKVTPRATTSDGALPDAIFCPHDCACGATGKCGEHPLCEVAYDIGVNVLALTTKQQILCPYRVSFGCSEVCCCPRHYAIYGKTGR